MNNFKLLFLLLIVAFVSMSSSLRRQSFMGHHNNDHTFNNADKWIPADFDSRKNILLVQNFELGGNKNMEKLNEKTTGKMQEIMKENFPYKYEFASANDIQHNDKYADKSTYRYILAFSHDNYSYFQNGATSHNQFQTFASSNDFFIYDRKSDKGYPPTGKPSSNVEDTFKPVVLTIVQFLKNLK